jgi:hypothetical protein
MRMRIYYINCRENGLCCYQVIHIENLLRALQLFASICNLFTDSLVLDTDSVYLKSM